MEITWTHADPRISRINKKVIEIIYFLGYKYPLIFVNNHLLIMYQKDDLNNKAQVFKALAHPTRLYIVEVLLSGERCVNDITDLFDATQSNISQHLNILKFSGIVDYRQDKNLRCYFLKDPSKIKNLVQAVKQLIND